MNERKMKRKLKKYKKSELIFGSFETFAMRNCANKRYEKTH
jgi:hypothetical protein